MKFIFRLVLSALAVGIAAYLIPGVTVTVLGAFVAAIVLGILNLFIKPIITILTLPITVLTLGLFSLIVNALLVLFVSAVVPGFSVAGFWSALLFAIVLMLVNAFFHILERRTRD